MKTITAVALMTMGLAGSGMAAEYKGFVEDQKCSANPEMKAMPPARRSASKVVHLRF
jgi:hypothetical protein